MATTSPWSHSSPWGPGHVIAQKFRLVRRLGQGGMGSVWAADHLVLNSQVAVKIIDSAIAQHPDALARFLREAQAAAQLRSPHVVQTFDYGVEDDVPYIAMELLEGESLAQRLDKVRRLSVQETAKIITQVGRAIARAHEAGIVHRDLKPDNIYLVRNDDDEIAKVLDFGIAKATNSALGNSSQTRTGAILGTPYYMSPEQAEGNRSVDHRTDLWSLAIIAFECVTGRKPFESEALGDLILQICVKPIKKPSSLEQVPQAFDDWFAKGTQRDLTQRFQSARELTTELRAAAGLGGGETVRVPIAPTDPSVPGQSPLAQTPAQPLRDSRSDRSFGSSTGGMGAVARTSSAAPPQMSKPVIVSATIGALAFAGTIAFFALRAGSHESSTPPSASADLTHSSAVAPPQAESPKVADPAPTATEEPPSAGAVEAPAPSAQKPERPTAGAPGAAPPHIHAKTAAEHPSAPATAKPAANASKRVDFGF